MLGLEDHVEGEARVAGEEDVKQARLPRRGCLLPRPKRRPDAECPGHTSSLGIWRRDTWVSGLTEWVRCR